MIVYVVTRGSYSDYCIKRIFTERANAERYVSLNTSDDLNDIEEHETDDDKVIEQIRYVSVKYGVDEHGWAEYYCRVSSTTNLDGGICENAYIYEILRRGKTIYLTRQVDNTTDASTLEAHYKRVCEDLFAQIRSLVETEGWTDRMVDEWLADKGRWVL